LNDWPSLKSLCNQLLAINPLIKPPHRALATAARATDDDPLLIQSLRALSMMNPVDVADVHYRLAAALHRTGETNEARQQVLLALSQAPRYRDAHRLLLEIVDSKKTSQPASSKSDDQTPADRPPAKQDTGNED
jgi:tetratricopeptide (TPR) repeat protein